ncbi:hypothetical protein GIB67_023434 [Kingdonia uniflora]|uniref:Transposase-associated domain-containing protein n=1 Tax=Kingdonia uniflora TaxID=39325 RepID=A0A7J7P9W4_9MAGN|nr:hypothetical protein GIB67_023434 [Kingdonia uniflora]
MKAPRESREYMSGLELFIYFLIENRPNLGGADWYSRPCAKCHNRKGKNDLEHIHEHLIINGFDMTYTTWIHHGKQLSRSYVNSQSSTLPTNNVKDPCPPLVSMVNDTLEHLPNDVNATTFTCNNEGVNQAQTDLKENVKYKELMEDALLPLYPSCQEEHTRLVVIVKFLSMKSRYNISNECFTELLGYVKKILPDDNTLPNRTYTAKKLVKSSRMECQIIHAYRNDCILY